MALQRVTKFTNPNIPLEIQDLKYSLNYGQTLDLIDIKNKLFLDISWTDKMALQRATKSTNLIQ